MKSKLIPLVLLGSLVGCGRVIGDHTNEYVMQSKTYAVGDPAVNDLLQQLRTKCQEGQDTFYSPCLYSQEVTFDGKTIIVTFMGPESLGE